MTLVGNPCSPLETLRLYLKEELSDRVKSAIYAHLEYCHRCQKTVNRLKEEQA